jgi:hypothetical protein
MPSSVMLRLVALVRTDVSGDMVRLHHQDQRRFLQEPHSVTFQKTALFTVTAVKSSNVTSWELIPRN